MGGIGISVDYDTTRSVEIVYPCGTVETDADCELWWDLIASHYAKVDGKRDSVVVLDMFSVVPKLVPRFAALCKQANERFVRHCAIVNADPRVLGAMSTIGDFRHIDLALDIENAIACIMKKRDSEVRRETNLACRRATGS